MGKTQVNTEMIEYFLEELRQSFDVDVLQSGFVLYKNGFCGPINVLADVVISSVRDFDDESLYDVELDGDFFSISTCSCKLVGYCSHMASVIFQASALNSYRPEMVMRDILDEYKEQQVKEQARQQRQQLKAEREQREIAFVQSAPSQTKSPTKPVLAQQAHALSSDSTVEEWKLNMGRILGKRIPDSENGIYELEQTFERRLLPLVSAWPEDRKQIFLLLAYLEFLCILDSYFYQAGSTYDYGYIVPPSQHAYRDSLEVIYELLDVIDGAKLAEEHPEDIQVLQLYFSERKFIINEQQQEKVNWLELYRLFWFQLFVRKEWKEAEIIRLRKRLGVMEQQRDASDLETTQVRLALAHFEVMSGEHQEAFEILQPSWLELHGDLFIQYLHGYYVSERFDALKIWLYWLEPLIWRADQELFGIYIEYWQGMHSQQPCDEEFERILIKLLPHSFEFYGDFLLSNQQYRRWVDICLTFGVKFESWQQFEWFTDGFEREQCCMPLYHLFVIQSIERKNRPAYKDAVKALKRLRTFYQQQKKKNLWEQYMNQLCSKYNRFRALQEELKKGKLIS